MSSNKEEEKIEKMEEIIEKEEEVLNLDDIEKEIIEAAKIINKSTRIVLFTGAGMSAESGIDTFRGSGGFWSGLTGLKKKKKKTSSSFKGMLL